ncbi:CBS domain-containing protein [Desulfurivibrio dismutans]|uniref:CBS domain-containing protein n=1 Tax=Desulfurivibrio dismutans TaxID=1398908 RepID=UPI0023DA6169|nr:CBS domain-containing protein [Desulfurivibrio alkaliphilus]MDF1613917.1 CBS domain-containing protein [Desulfurivibrio alkaliphilus]
MDLITTHINADFDAVASMVAAKKLYPEAVLAFAGAQEKNLRAFFAQSVDYLYDFQRLKNIDLTKVSRLILVDTRQPSRLGELARCLANPGLQVHIFDHHPEAPGDLRGVVEHIRPVGSTTTIMVELFRQRGIELSPEEATLLAMGLYEDTGSFHFDTTTPEDMQAAAWLLSQGANLHTVTQFIAQELTSAEVTLLGDLIRSATTYTIQGLDITVAKVDTEDYFDNFAVVVRRFMVMENLNTLFALARMGERTYLIARSRIPEVNVGEIVREFGGGGHASAASATIKELTNIEVEEKLIQVLHKQVLPRRRAADLMSSPVISARPHINIRQADELLNRYNITVLPVVDDRQQVVGLISRRVAGKAIQLGLEEQPVNDYMTTDFATLTAAATLGDIQELIIEHRQRIIPVVDGRNGELQGVITRTDLLNLLVNDPSRLPRGLYSEQLPSGERQRNLQNLMVERLGRRVVVLLRTIGEVAQERKYHAFAVGGFVRDLLLQEKNFDIDVVIEGDGVVFAKDLAQRLGGRVRVHKKFQTAVVKLPDGLKVDVATARLEYYDYPAALPTVELSSLKLDLFRRDFTINAMAIHLNPDTFGTLMDFFNSQNDLKDHKIRVLHNLSFVEDPTRIFRAIRFEQRMGFTIGRHTERLIKNAVRMNLYDRFFGYRFFGELKGILSEETPLPAIRRMANLGLLPFLHPRLKLEPRLAKTLDEAQAALSWYQLLYRDEVCRNWLVYLLALTVNLKRSELQDFCRRFEVPERSRQQLLGEKTAAQQAATVLRRALPDSNSGIYHLLSGLGPEGLLYLLAISRKKAAKKAISLYVTELSSVRPELNGHDLKVLGYRPGPVFRQILDQLLDARLDGQVKNREEELVFVRRNFPPAK